MTSKTSPSGSTVHYLLIPIVGLLCFVLGSVNPDFSISKSLQQFIPSGLLDQIAPSQSMHKRHQYSAQVFSTDPLIIYIRNFVSEEEIDYLLETSKDKYQPSMVYSSVEDSLVDTKMRRSESAYADSEDPVVRRIAQRAREFQGWRNRNTTIQPLLVQRYGVNGFYSYHFDWDEDSVQGNRPTTFMTYLDANCTGGGTNFPFLPHPGDERWCDVIACTEEERDGYKGVIFKPIKGSAIFWENFHQNDTGHRGVYHAGLPVRSGTKVGLNIWSWDTSLAQTHRV
ncbi:putative prolyl 4-hydroxylase alpha subunit [Xylariaceae sp. FL1019]|nr:putative prolyl 4-hydroxylase alpha subunit [Xylariaceae sp. FL1019]